MKKQLPILATAILLLTLALSPASSAEAQGGPDLLVRIWQSSSIVPPDTGPITAYDEVLLFRDGLVLLLSEGNGGQSRTVRAEIGDDALDAFKAALIDGGVGDLEGRCDVSGVGGVGTTDVGAGDRETLMTWYGTQGRRSRHLPIGHTESSTGTFGETCPDVLRSLLVQALSISGSALAGPSATDSPDENYPLSLLFDTKSTFVNDPDCGAGGGFVEDFVLFRDGLLVRTYEDSDGNYRISRAFVPGSVRRTLQTALVEEEISDLQTGCKTWFFLPFIVEGQCLDYSWDSGAVWLGRQGRRGRIFGNETIDLACNESQARVRGQLMVSVLNALSFASVQSVEGIIPLPRQAPLRP